MIIPCERDRGNYENNKYKQMNNKDKLRDIEPVVSSGIQTKD